MNSKPEEIKVEPIKQPIAFLKTVLFVKKGEEQEKFEDLLPMTEEELKEFQKFFTPFSRKIYRI